MSQTRDNTFTMVLDPSVVGGEAVLIPCVRSVATIDDVIEEAESLWRAESWTINGPKVSASWGCVGALFSPQATETSLKADWSTYFLSAARPTSPVDENGILRIPWPELVSEGTPVDADIILATATHANVDRATPSRIADAWIEQDEGAERYFLSNVQQGIRTADDADIAARIALRAPTWIGQPAYEPVLQQLLHER